MVRRDIGCDGLIETGFMFQHNFIGNIDKRKKRQQEEHYGKDNAQGKLRIKNYKLRITNYKF